MALDFSQRTKALFGEAAFAALGTPLVAISGMGGVGGAAFMTLVRSGVRRFRLAENGVFDPPDMNRQWGALDVTMDRPKLDVYAEWARGINPDVALELFPEGITVDNAEAFLAGCDFYLGAIDVDKGRAVKAETERISAREGIPLFTCGAFGMGAVMVNCAPGGMTLEAFWRQISALEHGDSSIPPFLRGIFGGPLMDRLEASFGAGTLATCASGAGTAGLLVGTEMLVAMLQGSGVVDRAPVFAPRFTVVDLAGMRLQVVDVLDTDR